MKRLLCIALLCAVACGGETGGLDKEVRSGEALCNGDGQSPCATGEAKDKLIDSWCRVYGGNGTTQYPWKYQNIHIEANGTMIADNNVPEYCFVVGETMGIGFTYTGPATYYEQPGNVAIASRGYGGQTYNGGSTAGTPNGGCPTLQHILSGATITLRGSKYTGDPLADSLHRGWAGAVWTKDAGGGVSCLR